MDKTNAIRQLERKKQPYSTHSYDGGALSGTEVAATLGLDAARGFKTLVTTGKSGAHYVFLVPVAEELDLKKAAKAAGEKSVEMIHVKDITKITGYVRGGCSPLGMKKLFPTVIDESAKNFAEIYVSGGRIGSQIELTPENLAKAANAVFAEIIA